jgi:endoglucanase
MKAFPLLRYLAAILAITTGVLIIGGCAARPHNVTNPLAGHRLYFDPLNPAAVAVRELAAAGNQADADRLAILAREPTAQWLTGSTDDISTLTNIINDAAAAQTLATVVLYNLPQRDVGAGQSSGGAADTTAYLHWVETMARTIGDHAAIVIMEPDGVTAVADQHLTGQAAQARLATLRAGIQLLAKHPNTFVYLDAGNAGWQSPEAMVDPLKQAGVQQARGIAVNVSNFFSDAASTSYAEALAQRLGGTGIVIDTSRNGTGPSDMADRPWCNPPGRTIGQLPRINSTDGPVQAWLWIKRPGESDGACRPGEPPAGQWWLHYALALVQQ